MTDLGFGFLAGLGFWPLFAILVWTLILFPLVALERTGFAILTVVVGAVLLQFVGGIDVWGALVDRPLSILMWVAVYVLVGLGYSFLRWDRYAAKWRREYEAASSTYEKDIMWGNQPAAVKNKNRITSWMMFWPWSAFWWFFSDFIVEAYEWLYTHFSTVYTWIAQRHLKGLEPPSEKWK
jgi:hypothetical protein